MLATGRTLEACREELGEVVEEWGSCAWRRG
ncbi:MAG: type II toxin-antitoxin system HicB family antitoxin, partial [candidate division NC10 bacterium]